MGLKYTARQPKLIRFPIGCTYRQYPSAASNDLDEAFPSSLTPSALFGGTWEELYSTEGIVFQTEGYDYDDASSANKRASGLMPDQFQRVTGSFDFRRTAGDNNFVETGTGMIAHTEKGGADTGTGITVEGTSYTFDKVKIDPSLASNIRTSHLENDSTSRTCHRNRLFKVWRRTA